MSTAWLPSPLSPTKAYQLSLHNPTTASPRKPRLPTLPPPDASAGKASLIDRHQSWRVARYSSAAPTHSTNQHAPTQAWSRPTALLRPASAKLVPSVSFDLPTAPPLRNFKPARFPSPRVRPVVDTAAPTHRDRQPKAAASPPPPDVTPPLKPKPTVTPRRLAALATVSPRRHRPKKATPEVKHAASTLSGGPQKRTMRKTRIEQRLVDKLNAVRGDKEARAALESRVKHIKHGWASSKSKSADHIQGNIKTAFHMTPESRAAQVAARGREKEARMAEAARVRGLLEEEFMGQALHSLCRQEFLQEQRMAMELRQAWLVVVALLPRSYAIANKLFRHRMAQRRDAAAATIQAAWLAYRDAVFVKHIAVLRHRMRNRVWLWRMGRTIARKQAAAGVINNLLRHMVSLSDVGGEAVWLSAMRTFRWRVLRAQRIARGFVRCRRARLKALSVWWVREEVHQQEVAAAKAREAQAKQAKEAMDFTNAMLKARGSHRSMSSATPASPPKRRHGPRHVPARRRHKAKKHVKHVPKPPPAARAPSMSALLERANSKRVFREADFAAQKELQVTLAVSREEVARRAAAAVRAGEEEEAVLQRVARGVPVEKRLSAIQAFLQDKRRAHMENLAFQAAQDRMDATELLERLREELKQMQAAKAEAGEAEGEAELVEGGGGGGGGGGETTSLAALAGNSKLVALEKRVEEVKLLTLRPPPPTFFLFASEEVLAGVRRRARGGVTFLTETTQSEAGRRRSLVALMRKVAEEAAGGEEVK